MKEETLLLAGWIILISSLPQEQWSNEQILVLYRARWQIELLFKRMKQIIRLGLLRCHSAISCQSTILLWLIAWALQEQQMQPIRESLQAQAACLQQTLTLEHQAAPPTEPPSSVVSSWRVATLGVQTLRVLVQGIWTLSRLQQCLPHLGRFLRESPRKRQQQEQAIRTMLTLLMGSDLPLESFFICSSA